MHLAFISHFCDTFVGQSLRRPEQDPRAAHATLFPLNDSLRLALSRSFTCSEP